jgi:hypothetical protein
MVAYATKKARRVVGLVLMLVILFPAFAAIAAAVLDSANGAS